MKKNYLRIIAAAAMIMAGGISANAQATIGNILEGVVNAASGNNNKTTGNATTTSTSGLLSGLTTIFQNSKVATKDKIVGTWTYEEPAVVFESSNLLKQAGGKLMSSAIEKKLQSTLTKYGIKKGKMKMTFDKDGSFTQTINKKTMKGTYTLDGKNVKLMYAGAAKQYLGTTQLDGNSLLIVMDVSKLLKFANTISTVTNNSLLKTAGSMLSGMDGMECGLRLKKTE